MGGCLTKSEGSKVSPKNHTQVGISVAVFDVINHAKIAANFNFVLSE